MIAYELGDVAAARERLQEAIDVNPRFSVLYAGEAAAVLSKLATAAHR